MGCLIMLHNDIDLFRDTIVKVAQEKGINESLIEKDYYVTIILNALAKRIDGIVFKGGTCLSKCHKIIKRFSEDIDLTLDLTHFTQSNKRNSNKQIVEVCDNLGFNIVNRDQVINHSHGNYNKYEIEYPALFKDNMVKQNVQIEMVYIQKAYPDEIKSAISYIGEWFINNGKDNLLLELGIQPFDIKVQTLGRTFIDKVFAVCDYYLRNDSKRNSRHIYDLYKLYDSIAFNDSFKKLINNVREDRKISKINLSAKEDVNINEVLMDIVNSKYYELDYNTITKQLLFESLDYEEAIKVLQKIIDSKMFI